MQQFPVKVKLTSGQVQVAIVQQVKNNNKDMDVCSKGWVCCEKVKQDLIYFLTSYLMQCQLEGRKVRQF